MRLERTKFLLRRWYWNQPYHTRQVIARALNWLCAIAFGLTIAWLAAQGF